MHRPAFPGNVTGQDPELSDRQRRVLAALIAVHQRSARPVGSDAIAQGGSFRVSSTSLRNALADLEDLGLVTRPRPSAGRVPTRAGYDFFVRAMVTPAILPAAVREEMDRSLTRSTRDVERLLAEASRLLSSLGHQLGLALASSLEDERLARLDLEPLDARRALLVVNLEGGALRSIVLELESPLADDALADVGEVLRAALLGLPLREARERMATDPALARDSAVRMVVRAAGQSSAWPFATPLFSSGARHIVEQPEFAEGQSAGWILDVVERRFPLDHLMVSAVEGQVAVRVGVDGREPLDGCSLVSYALPDHVCGAVGLLGPRRMDYAMALAVVEAVGQRVADILHS